MIEIGKNLKTLAGETTKAAIGLQAFEAVGKIPDLSPLKPLAMGYQFFMPGFVRMVHYTEIHVPQDPSVYGRRLLVSAAAIGLAVLTDLVVANQVLTGILILAIGARIGF